MSAYKKYLAELFFYMKEFYDFETEFKSNLSQNYISGNIACLVDTDEIDNWKMSVAYDECLEFLENYDQINFEKKQLELFEGKFNKNRMNFKPYETINEICEALKHNKRISVISQQFLCYLNNITYSPTMFNYYIKNNQLIIYFGTGKCLFIPDYAPEKKLDSENVFIIDLPQNKTSFIEGIFKNDNMSDTFHSRKNLSTIVNNLLNFTINKNSMKKDRTYNFYQEDDDFLCNFKTNKSNNINQTSNNNFNTNINLNYSNNINSNTLNNNANNMNKSNNNDQMYMNYEDNLIDTQKPYIKQDNLIEEYQYMTNNNNTNSNNFTENNNNDIQRSQDKEKDNDSFKKKNDEYNKGYKNTYKEKEIEYHELLKEKNNNLDFDNNKDLNNKDLNNNINDNLNDNVNDNININNNEDNNIEPNLYNIQEKKEIKISEENNYTTPDGGIVYEKKEIIIHNNNNPGNDINNNLEDKKDTNEIDNNINNINNNDNLNLNSNKVEKSSENPIPDKKEEEIKDANPDDNIVNNNNINNDDNNAEMEDNCESEKFRIIGLDNINGKSSYINSAIQCLSNTIPLTNYFLNDMNKEKIIHNNISINNPDAPQLSPSYLNIIQNLWNNNNPQLNSFPPSEFVKNIKKSNSEFEKEEENDVGRLIIYILDCFDAELNNNIKKNEDKKAILLSSDKNEIKNIFYNDLLNNNSIIYETFFGGVCEITHECQKCKEECDLKKTENEKMYEYQNLNYLMFQINDIVTFVHNFEKRDNIDIYDCLNYFQNPIIVDLQSGQKCEKCGQISPNILTSRINSIQNNLLVLLNRVKEEEKAIKFKIDEIVDVTGYVNECDGDNKIIFNLYGIICLSDNDIHYAAFCRNPVNKMWYKYNDNVIEAVNDLGNDVNEFGVPVALFYQMEIV